MSPKLLHFPKNVYAQRSIKAKSFQEAKKFFYKCRFNEISGNVLKKNKGFLLKINKA